MLLKRRATVSECVYAPRCVLVFFEVLRANVLEALIPMLCTCYERCGHAIPTMGYGMAN